MEYHAGDGMGSNRSALHVARDCMKSTAVTSNTIADCLKQAVGGRPGMQRKRAAAALSQTGRSGPDHAANTRRPAGRPHTPTGCTRQTSDRQHHRLMPPGWGIITGGYWWAGLVSGVTAACLLPWERLYVQRYR